MSDDLVSNAWSLAVEVDRLNAALTEARAEIERLTEQARRDREYSASQARQHAKLVNLVLAAESELSTLRARTSELAGENTNLRNDLVQRGMAEESLRARVREVVGPFSRLDISHTDDIDDSALVFENEGGNIVLGHLRAARQLNEDLK